MEKEDPRIGTSKVIKLSSITKYSPESVIIFPLAYFIIGEGI